MNTSVLPGKTKMLTVIDLPQNQPKHLPHRCIGMATICGVSKHRRGYIQAAINRRRSILSVDGKVDQGLEFEVREGHAVIISGLLRRY